MTPTSVSDLEEMRESFPDIKKCSSNVFVPIKRQNGRYQHLLSGKYDFERLDISHQGNMVISFTFFEEVKVGNKNTLFKIT